MTQCREKLRAAGEAYPKSGCNKCGSVIKRGWVCPEQADVVEVPPVEQPKLPITNCATDPFWNIVEVSYGVDAQSQADVSLKINGYKTTFEEVIFLLANKPDIESLREQNRRLKNVIPPGLHDLTETAGISWNGFNIVGDLKSRNEVQRLMHTEARLRWFEGEWAQIQVRRDTEPKAPKLEPKQFHPGDNTPGLFIQCETVAQRDAIIKFLRKESV